MYQKTLHLPVLTKLAAAERYLVDVLDHPAGELNAARIRMALAMIKFERLKQQGETEQEGRIERNR